MPSSLNRGMTNVFLIARFWNSALRTNRKNWPESKEIDCEKRRTDKIVERGPVCRRLSASSSCWSSFSKGRFLHIVFNAVLTDPDSLGWVCSLLRKFISSRRAREARWHFSARSKSCLSRAIDFAVDAAVVVDRIHVERSSRIPALSVSAGSRVPFWYTSLATRTVSRPTPMT